VAYGANEVNQHHKASLTQDIINTKKGSAMLPGMALE